MRRYETHDEREASYFELRKAGIDDDPLYFRQQLSFFNNEAKLAWLKKDSWLQPDRDETGSDDKELAFQDALLLPDRVFGFVLRTHTWGTSGFMR